MWIFSVRSPGCKFWHPVPVSAAPWMHQVTCGAVSGPLWASKSMVLGYRGHLFPYPRCAAEQRLKQLREEDSPSNHPAPDPGTGYPMLSPPSAQTSTAVLGQHQGPGRGMNPVTVRVVMGWRCQHSSWGPTTTGPRFSSHRFAGQQGPS